MFSFERAHQRNHRWFWRVSCCVGDAVSCPKCGAPSVVPPPEMMASIIATRVRLVELGLRKADEPPRGLLCEVCLLNNIMKTTNNLSEEGFEQVNAPGGAA